MDDVHGPSELGWHGQLPLFNVCDSLIIFVQVLITVLTVSRPSGFTFSYSPLSLRSANRHCPRHPSLPPCQECLGASVGTSVAFRRPPCRIREAHRIQRISICIQSSIHWHWKKILNKNLTRNGHLTKMIPGPPWRTVKTGKASGII